MGIHTYALVIWTIVFTYYHVGNALSCTCGNIQANQTVVCDCTGSDSSDNVEWSYNNVGISTCFVSASFCTFPTPSNGNGATFAASDGVYTISIPNFSVGACRQYKCRDQGNYKEIYLPYCPVLTMTKPTTDNISINENTQREFICTFKSSPTGTIEWYSDSGTGNDVKIIDGQSSVINSATTGPDSNQEYTVTSTLRLFPNRTYHGNRIYCKATNKPEQTPLISDRKPQLNIKYYSSAPVIEQGSPYSVIEGGTGQLTCSVTGGNPIPTLSWNCNSGTQTGTSTNGETRTRTVTWTADRSHNNNCRCTSSQPGLNDQTASATISVLYPPSQPTFRINGQTITGDIKIIENNQRTITCQSTGNPAPTLTWQKPHGSSATMTGASLTFNSIRKTDQGSYTCTARNTMNPTGAFVQTGNSSASKDIVVLYPPSMLNFTYGSTDGPLISRKSIDVIKGDTISIGCNAMDGEPVPAVTWSGQSNNNPVLNVQNIQSPSTQTCTATSQMVESGFSNTVSGTTSDNVSINLLIPPNIYDCTFKNNKTNTTITISSNPLMVLENESITLTCNAGGTPSPDPMWNIPGVSSPSISWSIAVNNVPREKSGIYVFSATNEMKPSFQQSQTKSANKSITVEILYPPSVAPMQDVSLLEGKSLQVTCDVTVGYPISTTTRWTKDGTMKSNTKQLSISSVQKTDAGRYTCTSSNTMSPSGDTQRQGTDSKQFVLTVLYAASVTSFDIEGHNEQTTVTVDENSPVPFKCSADGVPTAKTSIKYGSQLLNEATSNTLEFDLPQASCQDAGTYVCAATNLHNGDEPTKTIKLFVNCKPRSADIVNENQTSEKGSTHTFTFNAIAYPEPTFAWKKRSAASNSWNPLQNGDNILITTRGLQSNLTIRSVTQSDFTLYLLEVSNNFGQEEYQYNLAPYDKPDAPSEFQHIAAQATESSIQLKWTPGSDGGPPQTFYIKYKKSSSQTWNFVSVPDNGEQTMSYKLTGLEKGAEYHLILYSSNEKGNSSESEILTAHTQGGGEPPITGPLIGGAVGGAACLAIIVLLVAFFLRRYKSGKGKKGSDTELNRRSVSDDSDDEMTENPAYVTSGAVAASASDNTYSQVQKKPKASNPSGDIYAVVNKHKGKDKKKNQKDKSSANANAAGDVYENVQPQNGQQNAENTYGNVGAKDSTKQPKKKNVNQDGLIYVELDFDKQQKGKKPTIIIGDDDRTPYADVDFTKRADPLPDSDEDNP